MPERNFMTCLEVEAKAMEALKPFIAGRSGDAGAVGRYVLTDKGPLSREIQETVGDVMLNERGSGKLVSVEIKAERFHTGKLFLECWSNLNLHDRDSWEKRGSNPGWAWKMHPTYLFYYFIDNECLYVLRGHALWEWMHNSKSKSRAEGATRIHDFKKVRTRADQLNDTWGHLVPIGVLRAEVGLKEFRPLSDFTRARYPSNLNTEYPEPDLERDRA